MPASPNPRPFLKWAGGKTQISSRLVDMLPESFSGYHEPFIGGGALFFRLWREGKIRGGSISDLNAELMDTYCAVRDETEALIALLGDYPYDRDFYYEMRARDPWQMSRVERAARMIYLNKSGYNGLYRVNRRGQFNVPFGRHRHPEICDAPNLRAVSMALRDVDILCTPFDTILDRAACGDMVYFDPPYVPLSRTASFTAYQAGGFNSRDQEELSDIFASLADRGVYVLLSNSDTPYTRDLYNHPGFWLDVVPAGRAINSKVAGRGKLNELIVTSYPPDRVANLPEHDRIGSGVTLDVEK